MTEVDLTVADATVTNITNEVINLFYVIMLTIRKFADLIVLIGIVGGVAIGIQSFMKIISGFGSGFSRGGR